MGTKSNFRNKMARDLDQQKRSAASYGYLNLPEGLKVFTPPLEGRVKLDFLPYVVTSDKHPDKDLEVEKAVPGTEWWKFPFKIHRNIGTGSESENVVCPGTMGLKCPICEYRMKKIREKADKSVTDALRASSRTLYLVIPLEDPKYEESPHIFDISYAMFGKRLRITLEEDDSKWLFWDLEEGFTVKARFEEKQIPGSQPFPETISITFSERDSQYKSDLLKELPSLDKVLKILPYEELANKFFNIEDDENKNQDEITSTEEEKKEKTSEKVSFRDKYKSDISSSDKKDKDKTDDLRSTKEEEKISRIRTRRESSQVDFKAPADKEQSLKEEKQSPPKKSEDKCPHGHEFGKDIAEFPDCTECELWDSCDEEATRKEKQRK